MSRLRSTIAFVAVVLALGCGGDGGKGRAPAPASSFTPDAPEPAGPAIFLRGRPSADSATESLDVVARGIERPIHGAALRIHWDPALVHFRSAQAGEHWSPHAIALAKEGAPGELAIVWSEKGDTPGVLASDDTVLGTIDLERRTESADVGIRADRSTLRDGDGAPLDTSWTGGRLEARSPPR